MWKGILGGGVALVIAGSSLVYAQQRHRGDGGQRWRPNVEDMRAFGDARLAALKAGLGLTAEQERYWPAYEQARRELGKLRLDRVQAWRDRQRTDDPAERLRRRGTAMAETGAALQKLAEATDPLYKSLDEAQKRRFAALARLGGRGLGRWHHFRGRDRDGRNSGPRHIEFEGIDRPGEQRL